MPVTTKILSVVMGVILLYRIFFRLGLSKVHFALQNTLVVILYVSCQVSCHYHTLIGHSSNEELY